LDKLGCVPHRGVYVVAGANPDRPRPDLKKAWATLRASAALPDDVRIHDLRRTHGLAIARLAGLHVASKALRHSDYRVTARHYVNDLDQDIRAALDARADAAEVIRLDAVRRAKEG
jgi:integrase